MQQPHSRYPGSPHASGFHPEAAPGLTPSPAPPGEMEAEATACGPGDWPDGTGSAADCPWVDLGGEG